MTVTIPVRTQYDGKGFTEAERDAKRAQQEAIRATRAQLAEHRRVTQLTAKLDKDLAAERKRNIDLTKQWAGATLAAGAILAKAGFDAVEAARESVASDKELLGVLNSTGKAAAGFKEELSGLASELQDTTNFSDEAIQHVQALLLKFDNIGRDVTPRATQAVADLAEMMDGDLQGAAQAVGKALDGNVSALERTTGKFTDAQKEQIEALFEAGRAAEAQAIILTELESKVGGQAKAAREAAGGWKDMEVSAGELQEGMGKLLLAIGDSGVSGGIAALLDKFTAGATAWQGAIENAKLLARANEITAEQTEKAGAATEKATGLMGYHEAQSNSAQIALQRLVEWWYQGSVAQEDFGSALQQAAREEDAAKQAAEGASKALQTNTEATEENAAATEELARKLEAANQARRNVAGELLDITEGAAAETAETWDTYFEEEQGAWQDYQDNVAKIQTDSAKEQQRIQKDLARTLSDIDDGLAKDLSRIDKDLARDKAKAQKDAGVQIQRMQQDAARQDKQQRRQRQIDTRADERLFQFDMRQLAAEGEFNQILAAKERRRIEQEISAETTREQDRAERENRQVAIERTRADAQERIREMEAEAEEQKQARQEQAEEARQEAIEAAEEAEIRRQEELAQALADEQANYQERMEALRQNRDEKLAAIEEGKEKEIAAVGEALATEEDLTREQVDTLIAIAEEMGPEIGAVFAQGINDGFERELRIDQMLGGVSTPSGPSPNTGPFSNAPRTIRPRLTAPNTGPFANFQHGTQNFVVPPGFPDDSFTVGLSSGERVNVTPAGQGGGNVTVNVNGIGGKELAALLRKKVEEGLEEFYDEVIVPWANE